LAGIWIPPVSALLALLIIYPLWGWRRLHAIHRAISDELTRFASESGIPLRTAPAGLDPAGRSALALSTSIARLRDLNQFVSDTIEGVADPLIVTSMAGEVLLANRRAQSILGEVEPKIIAHMVGQAQQEDLILDDGRAFSPRATPLTSARGEQRGWILLLADITAIRLAERDREEALEFLSHDMRSPQAAIITLLESDGGAMIPKEMTNKLAEHARRTLRLADDFVQLARLRSTRFEPEETDLCDSVAEARDAVWPFASRKAIRIASTGLDEPHWVLGERHALTRAVLNLLDNAVKFSPNGTMVHCALEEVADQEGRWCKLSIRDSGPGISAEDRSRLFRRFGPVKNGSGATPGVGLGLNYARVVAERHGGTLNYAPAPSGGAYFILSLPI
jgi:signal transduction histidine kinase